MNRGCEKRFRVSQMGNAEMTIGSSHSLKLLASFAARPIREDTRIRVGGTSVPHTNIAPLPCVVLVLVTLSTKS